MPSGEIRGAATKSVTGFSPAPQTTNPAGTANQAAGAAGTAGSEADSSQGFLADILGTNTFTGLNSIGGSFGTLALQSSGPMFLSEMAQFFAEEGNKPVVIDDATNARLRRMIHKRVLVVMVVTYFAQTLDKGTLNFAR